MREMGWTWEDYLAQPQWLLDNLQAYLEAESDYNNKKNKE